MKYYKDTKNKPYVFEDDIFLDIAILDEKGKKTGSYKKATEIIANIEKVHNTTLTNITLAQYKALVAPTFTELKTTKLSVLEIAYTNANELDISYMNTTFQADTKSQDLIVKVLSAGSVPSGFFWIDKANNQVTMTFTQLQGLSGAILTRNQTNFIKFQGLKYQVKLAKTQAALDKIVW